MQGRLGQAGVDRMEVRHCAPCSRSGRDRGFGHPRRLFSKQAADTPDMAESPPFYILRG